MGVESRFVAAAGHLLAALIGMTAVGMEADPIVVKGDPATRITDIEQLGVTFKDGVGYGSVKLIASVRGRYGAY